MTDDKSATEYLANKRTFLAWVRTSIAIISLGFVLAKFDVWRSQSGARPDPHGDGAPDTVQPNPS